MNNNEGNIMDEIYTRRSKTNKTSIDKINKTNQLSIGEVNAPNNTHSKFISPRVIAMQKKRLSQDHDLQEMKFSLKNEMERKKGN